MRLEQGNGYRIDKTKGIATGNEEESMYMVTSGRHFNDLCCFDYGNAETDNTDDGDGTMGPWLLFFVFLFLGVPCFGPISVRFFGTCLGVLNASRQLM